MLADKGAKCSAQVQHRKGGLRGNKKGIEDTELELCRVCCAADTLQVHFPFGAKREGFHDTDGRSGLEFSLVMFKDFIGDVLPGFISNYLIQCPSEGLVSRVLNRRCKQGWRERCGALRVLIELFFKLMLEIKFEDFQQRKSFKSGAQRAR